jgi:ribonuclease D
MAPEQLRRPARHEDVPELDAAVALLAAWVTELASTERIDKRLLATRDDVKDLVYGRPSRLDHGWRAARCGQELRKVLDGRAVIRLVDGGRHLRLEDD